MVARLDTRWWNLAGPMVAVAAVGCGPSIVLSDGSGTDTGGTDVVDDGIEPDGGVINCQTNDQCPAGLVCIDNRCVDDGYSEFSEYGEEYYGEEYYGEEYYGEEYVDTDEGCTELGPEGQCCDFEPCPVDCADAEDCLSDEACVGTPGEGGQCQVVPALPVCDRGPTLGTENYGAPGGEIVNLAFLDADATPGQELLITTDEGEAFVLEAGGLPTPLALPTTSPILSVASADFNGDAIVDLFVTVDEPESGRLLFGDGAGGFLLASILSGPAAGAPLVVLDFDGDGALDIAHGGSSPGVLLGGGDGMFSAMDLNLISPSAPDGLARARVMDPGLPDDVAVATTGGIELFVGFGDAGPKMPGVSTPLTLPATGLRVHAGDFDGDGVFAVVASSPRPEWTHIESQRPQGTAHVRVDSSHAARAVRDFDGDGTPDLIGVGGHPSKAERSGALWWATGTNNPDTAAVFDCWSMIEVGLTVSRAAVGDHDGNGAADVAIAEADQLYLISSGGAG